MKDSLEISSKSGEEDAHFPTQGLDANKKLGWTKLIDILMIMIIIAHGNVKQYGDGHNTESVVHRVQFRIKRVSEI